MSELKGAINSIFVDSRARKMSNGPPVGEQAIVLRLKDRAVSRRAGAWRKDALTKRKRKRKKEEAEAEEAEEKGIYNSKETEKEGRWRWFAPMESMRQR